MTNTKRPKNVSDIVSEFERRSVDAEYAMHKDSFWFEEGEHLRYDQEAAARFLTDKISSLIEAKIEELEGGKIEMYPNPHATSEYMRGTHNEAITRAQSILKESLV